MGRIGRSMETVGSKKIKLSNPLYNFIVKGQNIYCFSWKYNCFLKINISSGEIVDKWAVKEYLPNAYMLFRLINVKDSIVAFPYTANCVLKWKTCSSEPEKISLPFNFSDDTIVRKFNTFAIKEEELFLFPADIDYVCCLNIKSNEIKEVLNIKKYLWDRYRLQYSFLFANGSYLFNDKVYLGCWESNNIVIYDIGDNTAELVCIEEIETGVRSICGYENKLFILSSDGKVAMRNLDETETAVVSVCYEDEMQHWNTGEERMVYAAGYVFLFTEKIELSRRIRISDGHTEFFFDEQTMLRMKWKDPDTEIFFGAFVKGKIYVYSDMGDIYWYDAVSKEKVGYTCLKYDGEELAQWIRGNSSSGINIREDGYIYRLLDLFALVTQKDKEIEYFSQATDVGKSIYMNTIKIQNEER